MRKIIKKIIILILVIFIGTDAFATSIYDLIKIVTDLDVGLAIRIGEGFDGSSNSDYNSFTDDLQAISCESIRGNVAVVKKTTDNRNLLLGHSVVALGYNSIKNEPIDIVGLVGGKIDYAIGSYYYLTPRYEKVVFWIGINDFLMCKYFSYSAEITYEKITSNFDRLAEIYKRSGAKVYFVSIAPTFDYDINFIIEKVNTYLGKHYDCISVPYYPDLNEHHYRDETFKRIYDGYIKPVFNDSKIKK